MRSLRDAAKESGECARVELRERTLWITRVGQLEERRMQTLVEDAVAVVIEPEDLHAIPSLASEDKERAALRIERQRLAHDECECVE